MEHKAVIQPTDYRITTTLGRERTIPAWEVRCTSCGFVVGAYTERDDAELLAQGHDLAAAQVEQLRTQRDAVLALHRQSKNPFAMHCGECMDDWPCATVRALGVTE